jgi:hypothetical protein
MLFRERAPLRASEPKIGRVLAVAYDLDRTPIFEIDEDPAIRMTEATDRWTRFRR